MEYSPIITRAEMGRCQVFPTVTIRIPRRGSSVTGANLLMVRWNGHVDVFRRLNQRRNQTRLNVPFDMAMEQPDSYKKSASLTHM